MRRITESVRLPDPTVAERNATFGDGVLFLTVQSFLSTNANEGRALIGWARILLIEQFCAVCSAIDRGAVTDYTEILFVNILSESALAEMLG